MKKEAIQEFSTLQAGAVGCRASVKSKEGRGSLDVLEVAKRIRTSH